MALNNLTEQNQLTVWFDRINEIIDSLGGSFPIGPIKIEETTDNFFDSEVQPVIFSSGPNAGDFNAESGHLVLQPASDAARDIVFGTGNGTVLERLRIFAEGHIRQIGSGGGEGVHLDLENTGSGPVGLKLFSGHGNWSIYNSKTINDALEFRDESASALRGSIRSDGSWVFGNLTGAPDSFFHIFLNSAGTVTSTYPGVTVENNSNVAYTLLAPAGNSRNLEFKSPTTTFLIQHSGIDQLDFWHDGGVSLRFDEILVEFNASAISTRDFRIRGGSEPDLFRIISSTERIGVNTATPDGKFHIHKASAGVVDAPAGSEFILEDGATNNNLRSSILFAGDFAGYTIGNATDNLMGEFQADVNGNLAIRRSSVRQLAFRNGGVVVNFDQNSQDFIVSGDTTTNFFTVDVTGETVRIGGNTSPDGQLHIGPGLAGTITAHSDADELILEGTTRAGFSTLTQDGGVSVWRVGSPTNGNGFGRLSFFDGGSSLRFAVSNVEKINLSSGEFRINYGGGTPESTFDFRFDGGNLNYLFFLDSGQNSGAMGTNNPDASAILDIVDNARGVLLPRMTDAEMQAIPSPAQGLLQYNTTVDRYFHRDGNNTFQKLATEEDVLSLIVALG